MNLKEIQTWLDSSPDEAEDFYKHFVPAADHEATRRAQAGSDKMVSELKKQIESLQAKTPDRDPLLAAGLADLAARDQLVKLKERAIDYALENNIPVKLAIRAVEDDEDKTITNLDEYKNYLSGLVEDSYRKGLQDGTNVVKGRPGGGTRSQGWTPAAVKGLSVSEQSRLYNSGDSQFKQAWRMAYGK